MVELGQVSTFSEADVVFCLLYFSLEIPVSIYDKMSDGSRTISVSLIVHSINNVAVYKRCLINITRMNVA